MVKTLPARVGDMGSLPGLERSLEEERATHSDLIFPGTFHGQKGLTGYI